MALLRPACYIFISWTYSVSVRDKLTDYKDTLIKFYLWSMPCSNRGRYNSGYITVNGSYLLVPIQILDPLYRILEPSFNIDSIHQVDTFILFIFIIFLNRNLMLYFWHHKIKWNYIHIIFISRSLHLHNIYNLHVE